uniref:Ubiquitin-like protease family profile domain-containing protein n=2 Tax=Kalmanozyma brasiliensis (strain GHG001) TaxID=1365824 RepID=V5EHA7_KALBG
MTKTAQRQLRQEAQNDSLDASFATFNSDEPADISAIEEVRNVGRQTHFVQPKRRINPRLSTPLEHLRSTSRDRSYSFSSDVSMASVSGVSHKTKSSTYKKRGFIYEKEHKRNTELFNQASFKQKISNALQNINRLRSAERKPRLHRKHLEQLAIKTAQVQRLIAQDDAALSRDASRVESINDLVQKFLRQKEFDAQTAVLPLPPVKLEEKKRLEKEQRAKMRRARGVLGRKALPERLGEKEEEAARAAFTTRGTVSAIPGAGVEDRDIAKLGPGQWLNDEVINFYGTLILIRANEADKKRTEAMKTAKDAPAPITTTAVTNGAVARKNAKSIPKRPYDSSLDAFWRVHFFSSFFWSNLKTRGFDGVKRWTRRIDIFSKDLILFPINLGNSHWVCGAINFRRRRFEYYDSLGARNSSAFTLMRTYVTEEARDKKKREIDLRGWVDVFSDQSPRQENGYDCGVFASMTLEQISRRGWHTPIPLDPPRIIWKDEGLDEGAGKMMIGERAEEDDDDDEYEWNFEQQNMPYLRKRMACEIYSKQLLD